ncbi:MAG: transcription-repair coupling factor [bacterium]|nr:transcription-repair coupling factor [bacterium]
MDIFHFDIPIKSIKNIALSGFTDELFCRYIHTVFQNNHQSILIVTASLFEANQLYDSLSNYQENVYLFPMDDFLTSEAIATSPDLMVNRLETINSILLKDHVIVVTNLMGYLRYLPMSSVYQKGIRVVSLNQEFDQTEFAKYLSTIGYKRESLVTKTGEFAVRGFIIDVFPLGEEHPIRFEFFGDTIDSIRSFDEDSQKSIEELKTTTIYPYSEFILESGVEVSSPKQKYLKVYGKVDSLLDYLNDPIVFYKDQPQLEVLYQNILEETIEYRQEKDQNFSEKYMFDFYHIFPKYLNHYLTIDNIVTDKNIQIYYCDSKEIASFHENIEAINRFLDEQLYFNKLVIIYLKEIQVKNFVKELNSNYVIVDEDQVKKGIINIILKPMNRGFMYQDIVVLTSQELFNYHTSRKKYKTKFKYASKIKDIKRLEVGDYVVHAVNGIGVYNGIKILNHGDLVKDYIEVIYAGNDKLYIPVEKIDLISKYSGNEGVVPKINKLGGSDWNKVKARVKSKIHDIADKLLKIYAEREMRTGFAFSKDTELQRQFDASFEYTETKDQLLAIEQIKEDMESNNPMDRLLCGDVGYGKTEVAFRAIFKAVMDSKQVLYLCPTTILSNQQYQNALVRFQNFPISIGLLNRFTTPKEKKRIIEGLEKGTVDFVIGTHRLLSNDIKPKDLGLLVIDEEQRFGVTHKEKIKEYKSNVDVLTLTATPIPRTLQMSMVGIRSLSLIETPPVDRYPVQTYVIEESNQIIKEAIYKELSRNGQIFLLYNRVENIEKKVYEIQSLVPEARIVYAHGQLTKEELEARMKSFIAHEYDILVCTTIIETGIDIPNANTLIILDADRFGLSQLYQIRGRVGRSNKIAYAYLMYSPSKMLNDAAVKRLNAIKDFTELGSGFSIATRDLSIRGAGDILGSEQAGFIDTVGIDLYLKMLQDEIDHLKGITSKEETIQNEKPLLDVSTHISDSYTDDDHLKISIHKQINTIDSLEKLREVQTDLEDRFGKLDEDIIIYMYEEWFEKLAKRLEIEQVKRTKNSLELIFSQNMTNRIDGEKLFVDAFKITSMFRFKLLHEQLIVILDTIKLEKHYIYYLVDLLTKIE